MKKIVLKKIIATFLFSCLLYTPIMGVQVKGVEFSDLPFGDILWEEDLDDDGMFMELQATSEEFEWNYTGLWYLPLKTIIRNGNMVELDFDGNIHCYDATKLQLGTPTLPITAHNLLDPSGPPGPFNNYSDIFDFDIDGDRLLMGERFNIPSEATSSNQLRFMVKNITGGYETEAIITPNDIPDYNHEAVFEADCMIYGDIVYAFSEAQTLYVFNATDWANPTWVTNISIGKTIPNPRVMFYQIENNKLIYFDGGNTITTFNLTDPLDPKVIPNSLEIPSITHEMVVQNNRLYIAAGKKGLYTYNISDLNNISLLKHYNTTIQDASTVEVYNGTAVYVGNQNGMIQLLNILDDGFVDDLVHFGALSCQTLELWDTFLIVGTLGQFSQVYDVSDPINPQWLCSNYDKEHVKTFTTNGPFFFRVDIGDVGLNENCPELNIETCFPSKDGMNITRSLQGLFKLNKFILYNDSVKDGKLTLDVTRHPIDDSLVTRFNISDTVFAASLNNCTSVEYTDPIPRMYDGNPCINFNVTWLDYQMGSNNTDLKPASYTWYFVEDIPVVENDALKVTFDLTYCFYIIIEGKTGSYDNYSIKLDTNIDNISMDFGSEQVPSALKLFSGYETSLNVDIGAIDYPLHTEVPDDGSEQAYKMEGSVMSLTSMENWSLNTFLDESVVKTNCELSVIPKFFDGHYQAIGGDSEHIYSFIMGVNLDITEDTVSIHYDPDTLYMIAQPDTLCGSEIFPLVSGYNILIFLGIFIGVIFISIKKISRRYIKPTNSKL